MTFTVLLHNASVKLSYHGRDALSPRRNCIAASVPHFVSQWRGSKIHILPIYGYCAKML